MWQMTTTARMSAEGVGTHSIAGKISHRRKKTLRPENNVKIGIRSADMSALANIIS
jgi:hypothetical protein